MKLLAIAGSLRENSYNRQLAEAAGALMREKHPEVGYGILRWEDVPFMNQDIEHPAPEAVTRVREAVREVDGLWLFSPEYNHAIPGPLKNLLDWLSRPVSATEAQVLAEKPVALAGASIGMSGASHAQDQLVGMLSFLDAHVLSPHHPDFLPESILSHKNLGILHETGTDTLREKPAILVCQ